MANTNVEKMTIRKYFEEIITVATEAGRDDLVEFAKGRIALIEKKNSNRKPTKTQEENEVLKDVVLAVVTDEGATISEIMAKDATLAGLSNQKVTALVKALEADGLVKRIKDGRKTLVILAGGEEAVADEGDVE